MEGIFIRRKPLLAVVISGMCALLANKIRRVVCSGCEPSYSGDASYAEFSDAYQMGCSLLKEEQPLVLYMDD